MSKNCLLYTLYRELKEFNCDYQKHTFRNPLANIIMFIENLTKFNARKGKSGFLVMLLVWFKDFIIETLHSRKTHIPVCSHG